MTKNDVVGLNRPFCRAWFLLTPAESLASWLDVDGTPNADGVRVSARTKRTLWSKPGEIPGLRKAGGCCISCPQRLWTACCHSRSTLFLREPCASLSGGSKSLHPRRKRRCRERSSRTTAQH